MDERAASLTGRVVLNRDKSMSALAGSESMMQKIIKVAVVILCLAGLLAAGVLGTETRLLFFWPSCVLLAAAGMLAVMKSGWKMYSAPSHPALVTALILGVYLIARGVTSPVIAAAREDIVLVLACAIIYILSATALSHARVRALLLRCCF